jgi:hypothetical protein
MPRRDSKPAIPASERLQTYALDRADTGIGRLIVMFTKDRTIQSYVLLSILIGQLSSLLCIGIKLSSYKINLKFYSQ